MFQAPRHVTDAVCSSFMGGVKGQALTERDPLFVREKMRVAADISCPPEDTLRLPLWCLWRAQGESVS